MRTLMDGSDMRTRQPPFSDLSLIEVSAALECYAPTYKHAGFHNPQNENCFVPGPAHYSSHLLKKHPGLCFWSSTPL